MPLWAATYCVFVTILILLLSPNQSRQSSLSHPMTKMMLCISFFVLFLLAFNIVNLPLKAMISTICMLFIGFWALFASRQYMTKEQFIEKFHQRKKARELALKKKVDSKEMIGWQTKPIPTYDFSRINSKAIKYYNLALIIGMLISVPLIYIYLKAVF